VLQEDGRPIVLQGGQHQAAGIRRSRGYDHGQPRDVRQPTPQRLPVLPAVAVPAAAWRPHHHRRSPPAARERLNLGGLVEQGVHAHPEEVDHVQLDHRAQPRHRRRHARTQEGALADRRPAHPLGPKAHQQIPPQQRDILPEYDNPRVLSHRLGQGIVNRLGETQVSHRSASK
jgi:hypothetical protein